MTMKNLKGKKGFTLIEIVAALAVLAIGILSILSLFPVGQQASDKSSKISAASLLGQKKLEELTRNSREIFLWDGSIGLEAAAQGDFSGLSPDANNLYEWEYDAFPAPSSTEKLIFISLGIYWPANLSRARQQSVKFATYISDYY